MDSHRCARPDPADEAGPWRCPECGMVARAALPAPVTSRPAATPRTKRTASALAIVTVVIMVAGALWSGMGTVLSPEKGGPRRRRALSLLAAVAVAYWQQARSKGEYPRCSDCGGYIVPGHQDGPRPRRGAPRGVRHGSQAARPESDDIGQNINRWEIRAYRC